MARRRSRPDERAGATPHPRDALSASSRRAQRATNPRRARGEEAAARDGAEVNGGLSAAGPNGETSSVGSPGPRVGGPLGAPNPIAHAAPDAEVAAARLALGTEEIDGAAEEELAEIAINGDGDGVDLHSGGLEPAGARVPAARRASILQRLISFLQGSWAELQRVQWPDRRQVMQATGVVIGFVIVVGVFLGLSDLASQHLMDWILK